jgi:hypothetical protein
MRRFALDFARAATVEVEVAVAVEGAFDVSPR